MKPATRSGALLSLLSLLLLLFLLGRATPGGAQGAPLSGVVTGPHGEPAVGAVVFLLPAVGDAPVPAAPETTFVDQNGLRFVPRVVAIRAGGVVVFPNSDPVMHNVFSPERIGAGFDLGTYPRTERRMYLFDQPGVNVVLCHVHPEMVAYVVVLPTPHRAVSDEEGRFGMSGVPPGRYRLRVWHPRWEMPEQAVTVGASGAASLALELQPARSRRRTIGALP